MSKRILILSSSPRKRGNSNALCDRFMQGAIEAGHQVEKVAECPIHSALSAEWVGYRESNPGCP